MQFDAAKALGKDIHKAWARIQAFLAGAQSVDWSRCRIHACQKTSLIVVKSAMDESAVHGWGNLYQWGHPEEEKPAAADLLERLAAEHAFEPDDTVASLHARFGVPDVVGYAAFDPEDWLRDPTSQALVFGFSGASASDVVDALLEFDTSVVRPVREPKATGSFQCSAQFANGGRARLKIVLSRKGCAVDLRIRHANPRVGSGLPEFYDHVAATIGKINAGKWKDEWVGTGARIPSFKAPKTSRPKAPTFKPDKFLRFNNSFKISGGPSAGIEWLERFVPTISDTMQLDEVALLAHDPFSDDLRDTVVARSVQLRTYGLRTVPLAPMADAAQWCETLGHTRADYVDALWNALGEPDGVAWWASGSHMDAQPNTFVWGWRRTTATFSELQQLAARLLPHVPNARLPGTLTYRTRLRIRWSGTIDGFAEPVRIEALLNHKRNQFNMTIPFPTAELTPALIAFVNRVEDESGVRLNGWVLDWRDAFGWLNSHKQGTNFVGGRPAKTSTLWFSRSKYRWEDPDGMREGAIDDAVVYEPAQDPPEPVRTEPPRFEPAQSVATDANVVVGTKTAQDAVGRTQAIASLVVRGPGSIDRLRLTSVLFDHDGLMLEKQESSDTHGPWQPGDTATASVVTDVEPQHVAMACVTVTGLAVHRHEIGRLAVPQPGDGVGSGEPHAIGPVQLLRWSVFSDSESSHFEPRMTVVVRNTSDTVVETVTASFAIALPGGKSISGTCTRRGLAPGQIRTLSFYEWVDDKWLAAGLHMEPTVEVTTAVTHQRFEGLEVTT